MGFSLSRTFYTVMLSLSLTIWIVPLKASSLFKPLEPHTVAESDQILEQFST